MPAAMSMRTNSVAARQNLGEVVVALFSIALTIVSSLLRRHAHGIGMRVRRILVDAPFDLRAEVAQQALHRPRRAVAERADGVALDLLGDLEQHVDLALVGAA